ncbi:MAG: TlpA disulfide reductase family protein [Candidatus Sulfotelmatobacter sp.]
MKTALAAMVLAPFVLVQGQTSTSVAVPVVASKPHDPAPAPDFALQSANGETVHLSDLRGRVVFLNFWATWCAPCKIMTPWLVEMQNQYGPRGLQIVGIALDEDATKVEIGESADSMRMNYLVLIGTTKMANAYGGVPALPMSFIVGRDGKIVSKIVGLSSKGEIEDGIKKALNL